MAATKKSVKKGRSTKPTSKQAKAMELIRQGLRPQEAMIRANYSPKTALHPKENLLQSKGAKTIIERYQEAYTRVGITPDYMASKTKEWLEAKKIKGSMTEPDKIVPDYETQLKAAEMVRKDWGLNQDMTAVQVNIKQEFDKELNEFTMTK